MTTDEVLPESEFRKALRECAPERRRDLLADHIAGLASAVMGLPPSEVLDPAAGFFQLGMDSLMSLTLAAQPQREPRRGAHPRGGLRLSERRILDRLSGDDSARACRRRQRRGRRLRRPHGRRSAATTFREVGERELTTATPDRARAIMTDALRKIDELSARLEIAEKSSTEPIAVVGIGCRFPGEVNNADQYWDLLKDGRSGIVRVPPERWDADKYYTDDHTVPGTICNREGGFLRSWQPDEFDAEFFAISPREAAAIDPQQRLLLEVACEALEDAGIPARAIRGTQTGVFVGLTAYDYMLTLSAGIAQEDLDAYILDRQLGELRGGTVGVLPRRAGSGHGPRHRVLVVADGDPPGLPEPAQPRKRHRTGRGRQPHAQPGREHRLLALGDAVARRPVQDLRRESRRLRPQRGLRGRGAQAARRCAARRGPRPGGGAGFGGQPGRRQQRGDRPERACPAGADCVRH